MMKVHNQRWDALPRQDRRRVCALTPEIVRSIRHSVSADGGASSLLHRHRGDLWLAKCPPYPLLSAFLQD